MIWSTMEIPLSILTKCSDIKKGSSNIFSGTVEVEHLTSKSKGVRNKRRASKVQQKHCSLTVSRSIDDKISFKVQVKDVSGKENKDFKVRLSTIQLEISASDLTQNKPPLDICASESTAQSKTDSLVQSENHTLDNIVQTSSATDCSIETEKRKSEDIHDEENSDDTTDISKVKSVTKPKKAAKSRPHVAKPKEEKVFTVASPRRSQRTPKRKKFTPYESEDEEQEEPQTKKKVYKNNNKNTTGSNEIDKKCEAEINKNLEEKERVTNEDESATLQSEDNSSEIIKASTPQIESQTETGKESENQEEDTEQITNKKKPLKQAPGSFPCEICGKVFRHRSNKIEHVRCVHTKSQPIQCPFCSTVLKHRDGMRQHFRIYHKEKQFNSTELQDLGDEVLRGLGMLKQKYKCELCDKKLETKKELIKHYRESHKENKDYEKLRNELTQALPQVCTVCGNTYTSIVNLRSHESRMHRDLKPVECPYCQKVIRHRYACRDHVRRMHKDVAEITEDFVEVDESSIINPKETPEEVTIQIVQHNEQVGQEERAEVVVHDPDIVKQVKSLAGEAEGETDQMSIDETARTLASLAESLHLQNGNVPPSQEGHTREFVVFLGEDNNAPKVNEVGEKRPPARCPICQKVTRNADSLISHVKNKHPNDPRTATIREQMTQHCKVKCPVESCGMIIANKCNLARHMDSVHGTVGVFQCQDCLKIYNSENKLNLHRKRVHSNVLLQCELCNKLYKSKAGLMDHIKYMHTDQREYKYECDICHKKFIKSGYLSTHKKTHLEVKRFECDICLNRFARNENLIHHKQRVHFREDAPSFPCSYCKHKFTNFSYLKVHITNVHTDNPRFVCKHCMRCFMSNSGLVEHIKGVHLQQKDHKCSRCGAEFSRRRALVNHRRKVHFEEDAETLVYEEEVKEGKVKEPPTIDDLNNQLEQIGSDSSDVSLKTDTTPQETEVEQQEVPNVTMYEVINQEPETEEEVLYEIRGLEEGEYVISTENGKVVLMSAAEGAEPITLTQ